MNHDYENHVMILEERLNNHLDEAAKSRLEMHELSGKIEMIHQDLIMLKSFVAGAGFVFGLIGSAITYIWDRIANH